MTAALGPKKSKKGAHVLGEKMIDPIVRSKLCDGLQLPLGEASVDSCFGFDYFAELGELVRESVTTCLKRQLCLGGRGGPIEVRQSSGLGEGFAHRSLFLIGM